MEVLLMGGGGASSIANYKKKAGNHFIFFGLNSGSTPIGDDGG